MQKLAFPVHESIIVRVPYVTQMTQRLLINYLQIHTNFIIILVVTVCLCKRYVLQSCIYSKETKMDWLVTNLIKTLNISTVYPDNRAGVR